MSPTTRRGFPFRPLGAQAIRDHLGTGTVRRYAPAPQASNPSITTPAKKPLVNDPEAAAVALLVRLSPDDLDALSKRDIRESFALGIHATERVLAKARERHGKPSRADSGAKSKSKQAAALSRLKSLQCRD